MEPTTEEQAALEAYAAQIGPKTEEPTGPGTLKLGAQLPRPEVPQGVEIAQKRDGHTVRALTALNEAKDALLTGDAQTLADRLRTIEADLAPAILHDAVAGAKATLSFCVNLLEQGVVEGGAFLTTRLDAEIKQIQLHFPITTNVPALSGGGVN